MPAGRTKCINHFLINNAWYLVDLPGYGYAVSSKDSQLAWNAFTREYFLERATLVAAMLLVDASVPAQAADLECAQWMTGSEVRRCHCARTPTVSDSTCPGECVHAPSAW